MATRNHSAISQTHSPSQRIRDLGLFKPFSNAMCAFQPRRILTGKELSHDRMLNINIEADDMNLMVFPQRGNFNTG